MSCMTNDPAPTDPQFGQEEELDLEVLDEVTGAGAPIVNITFN